MRQLPELKLEGGWVLRPVVEADAELAREWTRSDPWHQGMSPSYWLERAPGIEPYALVDPEGRVRLFARIETAARLLVQFNPAESSEVWAQNREALCAGAPWLARALGMIGVQEWFFDTQNPVLKRFAEKRLGFTAQPRILSKRLPQAVLRKEVPDAVSQGKEPEDDQ